MISLVWGHKMYAQYNLIKIKQFISFKKPLETGPKAGVPPPQRVGTRFQEQCSLKPPPLCGGGKGEGNVPC